MPPLLEFGTFDTFVVIEFVNAVLLRLIFSSIPWDQLIWVFIWVCRRRYLNGGYEKIEPPEIFDRISRASIESHINISNYYRADEYTTIIRKLHVFVV